MKQRRRKEILHELGLTPIWRSRADSILNEGAPMTIPVDQSIPVATATAPENDDRAARIARMDWAQLEAAVACCTACPLCQSRTRTVFGVGDEQADWLFIGEGPGAKEDEIGEPFVGQAGKLLDNMLKSIQLRRGDRVYITNIVKCRPPNNRNPEPSEAEQCHPYLARQIVLIKPKLIVALGKIAAQNLLHTSESIANLRGKLHRYSDIPLIVTYHPAYLLRSLSDKAKAWEDLCFAKATMQSLLVQ
jgi:DNA polymerase